MPRETSDERCEWEFKDRISNSTITLFYNLPETAERVAFANEQIVRKGNKIENKTVETRLKYGLRILTGFKEGDFTINKKPYSWDPQSPIYNPAWKAIVKKYAADLVSALAFNVFEASTETKTPFPEEDAAPEDTDGAAPGDGPAADSGVKVACAEVRDENPL